MENKVRKRIVRWILAVGFLGALMAGCGDATARITDGRETYTEREIQEGAGEPDTEQEAEPAQKEISLFVVTAIDEQRKILTLCDFESTRERPYTYTGATYIRGKHGDSMTVGQLSIGEIVEIERKGETLTNVQVSEDIFYYDNLYRFQLDLENKVLTVGNSRYFLDENLLAYQDGSKVSLSEISEQDVICLRGSVYHPGDGRPWNRSPQKYRGIPGRLYYNWEYPIPENHPRDAD